MNVMIEKAISWLLVLAMVLYVVSGFGITKSEQVTSMTGGLITKGVSYQIHNTLLIPTILLTVLHIIFSLNWDYKIMRYLKKK